MRDLQIDLGRDPVESIHQLAARLRAESQSFSLATVIEVQGSSSALAGSKAIFDSNGKNLLGWVGGGCAERFIGEQTVEALKENKTRIVLADLDDEIFGLGVACGGRMRVFIDPVPVAETVALAVAPTLRHEAQNLARSYGWTLKENKTAAVATSFDELFLQMAKAIATVRGTSKRSMRERCETTDGTPVRFAETPLFHNRSVTIVGRSRITESLARHFALLSYDVRVIGPSLHEQDYPSSVRCHCLDDSYDSIEFRPDEIVIIASHTAQDPTLVKRALEQKAAYVAMIGSRKRSKEVFDHLGWSERQIVNEPLFIPSGLDIRAANPDEIALSLVSEVLLRSKMTEV